VKRLSGTGLSDSAEVGHKSFEVATSMGNCNSLRRLMGSSVDTRTSGLAEAPAEEGHYGGVPQIIRSTHSEESTFIIFENRTGSTVKLFWLNYEGHEIPYRSIANGGIHRQQTFVTHPWTFKSSTGNPETVVVDHKRVVLPQRENKRIVLKRADSWKWTTENHQKQFPKEFKEATRAFLLAYYKHYNSSKEYDGSVSSRTRSKTGADLGDCPPEIILRIIELAAPAIPYILPSTMDTEVDT